MGCLKLLHEPWFHAVRGNHETMLLDFLGPSPHDGSPPSFGSRHMLLDNGGDWVLSLYDQQRDAWFEGFVALYEKVKRLPFVLIVGEEANRFNVVHADLYDPGCPGEVLHDSDLDQLAEQWSDFDWDTPPDRYPYFAQRFLWSRVVIGLPGHDPTPSFLPDLSPTFCGHTIVFGFRPLRSHICIDTGAFLAFDAMNANGNFGLTLADIRHRKLHFIAFPDQPKRIMTSELLLPDG